jgi:hypothetical protein
MSRRRFERMGRERPAKDQRRRPEFIEPGFEVGADEGACRVADDDDLAVQGPDGEGEMSRGGGWLSADMGQRQTLRPPCGDEGCDVLVGHGDVARGVARIVDRLLRVDDEEHGVRGQPHGRQGRRGASAQ